FFDTDEDAVVGDATNLAADDVTRVVLAGEDLPRIGLELLETEADALVRDVDIENHALDLLADLEELARVLGLLPRHLADVDEAFDARRELDERAVVGDRNDLARNLGADRVLLGRSRPRIVDGLLEAQRNALGLGVVLEDLDGHLVADVEHFARMIDTAPA